jgi:hypothetical protein
LSVVVDVEALAPSLPVVGVVDSAQEVVGVLSDAWVLPQDAGAS